YRVAADDLPEQVAHVGDIAEVPLVDGDADADALAGQPDQPDPVPVPPQVDGVDIAPDDLPFREAVLPVLVEDVVGAPAELAPGSAGLEVVTERKVVPELSGQEPAAAGAVDDPPGGDAAVGGATAGLP